MLIKARLVGGPNDGFTDHLRSDRLPQLVAVRFCDPCKRRHLFVPYDEPCEATYLLTNSHVDDTGGHAEYRYVSVDRTIDCIRDTARLARR